MDYGLCVTDYALDTELVPFLDEPALHPIIGASQSILPERKHAHVPLPGSPAVVRGGGWKDGSMKFGIQYQLNVVRPLDKEQWGPEDELRVFQEALDQIEFADKLGFDYVWFTEHHFLEEYSLSSSPEVFLAAVSQRTKNIRLSHGIVHMPPRQNHPARVAERIATLDLVSNGRVEFG